MKKIIISLGLLAFLVFPTVTHAAWWNPFTWRVFQHKVQTPVVVSQPVIQETPIAPLSEEVVSPSDEITKLQAQIDDLKKQQAVNVPTVKSPVVSKAITLPATPMITDVCLNIEGVQSKIPDGYSSVVGICSVINTKDLCPNIDGAQATVPAGMIMYKNINKCITEKELEELDAEQQEIANMKAAVAATQQASEEKQSKLNAINLEIANLNAKYAADSAERKLNKNGSCCGAMEADLNNLYTKYIDDYNALTAEYQIVKYSN